VKLRNPIPWISVSYSYDPKGAKEMFPMRIPSFDFPMKSPCSKRALRGRLEHRILVGISQDRNVGGIFSFVPFGM